MVRLLSLRSAGAILRRAVLPPGNDTAALLSAFATYAAGFLVRPFGALLFGRLGDLVGRKYTFLVTIMVMGIGDLPGRPAADLRVDRLAGADPADVAAPAAGPRARRRIWRRGDLRRRACAAGKRGYCTCWIQTTATLGLFMALLVISAHAAPTWTRRLRRLGLAHSVPALGRPARLLGLDPAASSTRSPIFQKMKEKAKARRRR